MDFGRLHGIDFGRFRGAVSPLRRTDLRPCPPTVAEVVTLLRPDEPVHCLRPAVLTELARRLVGEFPGDVLYAVKCNPEPSVLRALAEGGVSHFDAASLSEVQLVRRMFPSASIHFMHPVKARGAIRDAYALYGVRDFSLDCRDELDKIRAETNGASDLGLFVRLALPKGPAVYDLSGKFGASPEQAADLLREVRAVAPRVGVCFHVGSQCLTPKAYEDGLDLAAEVVARAGVPIEVMDIGGGFPSRYPDAEPPPLQDFIDAIARGMARLDAPGCRLWCEPGRALVASGATLLVRVELRRDRSLFINDGVYGSLFDAGRTGFRFPARLLRPEGRGQAEEQIPFELLGPTCDSADRMAGPFPLPSDTAEGDWIEIGQMGAYGACLRTAFNGFDRVRMVEVRDRPLIETPGWTI